MHCDYCDLLIYFIVSFIRSALIIQLIDIFIGITTKRTRYWNICSVLSALSRQNGGHHGTGLPGFGTGGIAS